MKIKEGFDCNSGTAAVNSNAVVEGVVAPIKEKMSGFCRGWLDENDGGFIFQWGGRIWSKMKKEGWAKMGFMNGEGGVRERVGVELVRERKWGRERNKFGMNEREML